jgi:hypothetical protein
MRIYIASSIAAVAAAATLATAVQAQAPRYGGGGGRHEITVNISKVRALDQMDVFSKGDFYARVSIAGVPQETKPIRQQADISPNWEIKSFVPPGNHPISVEILDKDLTKSEPIDINRVENKRQLDLSVNTRNCSISGLSGVSRCGQTIVRAGTERKKAEVTFTVNVKR